MMQRCLGDRLAKMSLNILEKIIVDDVDHCRVFQFPICSWSHRVILGVVCMRRDLWKLLVKRVNQCLDVHSFLRNLRVFSCSGRSRLLVWRSCRRFGAIAGETIEDRLEIHAFQKRQLLSSLLRWRWKLVDVVEERVTATVVKGRGAHEHRQLRCRSLRRRERRSSGFALSFTVENAVKGWI